MEDLGADGGGGGLGLGGLVRREVRGRRDGRSSCGMSSLARVWEGGGSYEQLG